MTKGATKKECEDVMAGIKAAYGDKPWFKKVKLDTDDHGMCVGVYVDRVHPERTSIPASITNVKVVTYLVG